MDANYEYVLNIRDNTSNLTGFTGAVRTISSGAARAETALGGVNTSLKNLGSAASGLDNLNFDLQTDITPLRRATALVDSLKSKVGAVRMLVTANTSGATASIAVLRTQIEAATRRRDIAVNSRDIQAANREIASLTTKMQKLEGMPPQGLFNRMGALHGNLVSITGLVAGIGVTAGLASFGGDVVRVTSDFQKYNAVLTNTFSSQVLAGQAMKDLQKFAKDTPYKLKEVTGSYIKFTGRGLAPTMKEMEAVGDLSGALGKDFEQLTEAILDVNNTERWTELGIKVRTEGNKIIGYYKGVTKEFDRSEKGALAMAVAFGQMKGVAGTSKMVAGTLGGQLSQLSDTFDEFKLRVGNALLPIFTLGIRVLNKLLDMGSGVVDSLLPKFEQWGGWITANTPLIESGLQGVGIAVGIITAGFVVLNATMLLNPIFLITAGIAAGVVGFGYLWAKSEEFRASVTGIWEVSKGLFTSFWDNGKRAIGGLIDMVSHLVAGMADAATFDFAGAAANFSKAMLSTKDIAAPFDGVMKDFNKGYAEGSRQFREVEEANKLSQRQSFFDNYTKKEAQRNEALTVAREKKIIANANPDKTKPENVNIADILNYRNTGNKSGAVSALGGAAGGTGSGSGGSSGIGEVKGDAKAVRNIATTIQNLNITLNITTNTITEGMAEVKRMVGATLLDAVNDLNYVN